MAEEVVDTTKHKIDIGDAWERYVKHYQGS